MRIYTFILILILSCQFAKGQSIVDNGSFLNESEISKLSDRISLIKKNTTVEILIYTTQDLNGKSPKEFGLDLSWEYPVGLNGINSGIVILLSKNDRKLQIQNGYGLEWILSDSESQSIVDEMIPYFKQQEFFKGIEKALTLIDNKVSKYDWTINSTRLDKITKQELGKIIKFAYTNTSGNTKYKYAIDTDPQFSGNFKTTLTSDNNDFELYYTKYMNDMIGKILTKSSITIYARLVDWNDKKLELLGVE